MAWCPSAGCTGGGVAAASAVATTSSPARARWARAAPWRRREGAVASGPDRPPGRERDQRPGRLPRGRLVRGDRQVSRAPGSQLRPRPAGAGAVAWLVSAALATVGAAARAPDGLGFGIARRARGRRSRRRGGGRRPPSPLPQGGRLPRGGGGQRLRGPGWRRCRGGGPVPRPGSLRRRRRCGALSRRPGGSCRARPAAELAGPARSAPAGLPHRGQSQVSGIMASTAKRSRVSCLSAHQNDTRMQGAASPRAGSPIGPAPTLWPRTALALVTDHLLKAIELVKPRAASGPRCLVRGAVALTAGRSAWCRAWIRSGPGTGHLAVCVPTDTLSCRYTNGKEPGLPAGGGVSAGGYEPRAGRARSK